MQDAFLQAFRSWPTFRGEAAPTTWLYRIAVNAALGARSRPRPTRAAQRAGRGRRGVRGLEQPTRRRRPARRASAAHRGGITRLPEELRVTVILRDVEGLSTAETAATLEISEAAVKSRLHRARLVLRRHLGDLFADR